MSDQSASSGLPEGFVRGGQPVPSPHAAIGADPAPWAAYPPPSATETPWPYAYQAPAATAIGGATRVGGPRRSPLRGRILAGVGTLSAVAILVAASGLMGGASSTVSSQATQPPVAAGGAQPGQSGSDPGAWPGSDDPGTNTGNAASSSGQQNASAAQSKGVVLIETTLTSGSAAGTGMVLDASGLVLTNYHVVQSSTEIAVTIASTGKSYTATVVGHDATNDVALLKLADASGLDTVTIDDDAVAVGDAVTAVGNAQGQHYLTAAAGEVTDTATTVTVSNESASGSETLKDVYETDAAAQPGDSGGPLFDAENEVTGMTTAGEQTYRGPHGQSSGQATTVASYAIPIDTALSIVEKITSGQESGTVQIGANPYLGIMVSTQQTGSAVVSSVTSGTPAAKAGIKAGSTITSIGGQSVSTQAEIAEALSGHDPGETVKVTWKDSSGTAHSAQVTLAESPVN